MTRTIFSLALMILLTSAISKESKLHNEFEWNEFEKLSWTDFRGHINPISNGDAASTISIKAKPYYKNKRLHYDVKASFLRDQSWCKSTSHDLLAHEQLHFDIAELYARLVRKKIEEYKRIGVKDVKEYNRAIEKILKESNESDKHYDAETLHGALKHKQEQWQKTVQEEMHALRAYKK